MATQPAGTPGTYGDELRRKGVGISPAATPTRSNKATTAPDNARYNGWEKGIAGEHRRGGTFMPYLDGKGNPIGVKPLADGKFHKAQKALADLRASRKD